MKQIRRMPVIPSADEVLTMLGAEKNLKHKAILFLIYGSGLRVSEVAKLKIGDICRYVHATVKVKCGLLRLSCRRPLHNRKRV